MGDGDGDGDGMGCVGIIICHRATSDGFDASTNGDRSDRDAVGGEVE